MKRRPLFGVVAASAVALAADARGDAPPGQYELFNQYDVSITDAYTGLTWQRGFGQQMSFYAAASYCQALALPPSNGWRVPSYKELLTLVDETPHLEYGTGTPVPTAIDKNAFGAGPSTPGTPAAPFWTSSWSNAAGEAYYVDFSDGHAALDHPNESYYVRCVQR